MICAMLETTPLLIFPELWTQNIRSSQRPSSIDSGVHTVLFGLFLVIFLLKFRSDSPFFSPFLFFSRLRLTYAFDDLL